jgi:hypothetical protein
VHNAAGHLRIRTELTRIVADLDEEFSRDQVDTIIRHVSS